MPAADASTPTQDQLNSAMRDVLAELLAPAARLEVLRRKELLTGAEVEALYGLDAGTLENWRLKGRGPEPTKIGKRVYYRQAALQLFILARQQRTYA